MIYNVINTNLTTLERPIYGSSRLGIMNKAVVFNLTGGLVSKSNSTIGIKEYELSDHLGNVNVVILDRKTYSEPNFWAYFKSFTDNYPFGYPISFRTHGTGYRYGFNGQEMHLNKALHKWFGTGCSDIKFLKNNHHGW